MNSDRLVESAAQIVQQGKGFSAVIVSLQQTRYDHMASLLIFARIDETMELLAREFHLPPRPYSLEYSALENNRNDVFPLPKYNTKGYRDEGFGCLVLDLRTGRPVRIVNQPECDRKRRGNMGVVVGKTSEVTTCSILEGKMASRNLKCFT